MVNELGGQKPGFHPPKIKRNLILEQIFWLVKTKIVRIYLLSYAFYRSDTTIFIASISEARTITATHVAEAL